MIEPQTVAEAVKMIFDATKDGSMDARVMFEQLVERVLQRNLNDMERERAWYEYLGLFI
jgi:hypothetical protein